MWRWRWGWRMGGVMLGKLFRVCLKELGRRHIRMGKFIVVSLLMGWKTVLELIHLLIRSIMLVNLRIIKCGDGERFILKMEIFMKENFNKICEVVMVNIYQNSPIVTVYCFSRVYIKTTWRMAQGRFIMQIMWYRVYGRMVY